MSYQGHSQAKKGGGGMGIAVILGLLGLAGAGAIYMKTRKPKAGAVPSMAGIAKSPGCGCGH